MQKKIPASAKKPPSARDVAFKDGGLDGGSSSDDDVPLLQRAGRGGGKARPSQ